MDGQGWIKNNQSMRAVFLSLCFLFFSVHVFAQIELTRHVIGSLGEAYKLDSKVEISYTVGEAVTKTVSKDNLTLTQGFQQPGFIGNLDFEIAVTDAMCHTSTDGSAMVMNIVGCTAPYRIRWSNGSKTNVAQDLGPGLHSVTIETKSCSLTKTFDVGVMPGERCDIRFFNAFSPNDDGLNDTWEIENIESGLYDNNKVEIYNRWGQRVWAGKHYNNKDVVWKGKNEMGQDLPSGTYFYLATINDKLYKGFIELTR